VIESSGTHGIGEYIGDDELGRGESPFVPGCGPVDSAELDGPVSVSDLVEDLGLCSPEWFRSCNRGSVGALVWSAMFANRSSHDPESHRLCDVAVPSSATSATLTCTPCTPRTTTGAASAKLTVDKKRKSGAIAMYRRILVRIVARIGRGYRLN